MRAHVGRAPSDEQGGYIGGNFRISPRGSPIGGRAPLVARAARDGETMWMTPATNPRAWARRMQSAQRPSGR